MHRLTRGYMAPFVKFSLAALVMVSGLSWLASARWNSTTAAMRARLLDTAVRLPPGVDPAACDSLPAPVARYVRVALRGHARAIRHARVAWAGDFNMGAPGADRWAPFSATQDFVPAGPGMVWDARIRMLPGLTVRVRDALVDGQGSMYGAVLAVYPVVNSRGNADLTTASLQRYLAEAVWLPTALLPSQGVSWTSIDETRALATIEAGHLRASAEFRFGDDGLVTSVFVPDRLFDDGRSVPRRLPWQGRYLGFTELDGLLVPSDAVVEWLMPEGAFAYWRGHLVSVEYRYAQS